MAAAVVIIAGVIGWSVLLPTGRPQVGAPAADQHRGVGRTVKCRGPDCGSIEGQSRTHLRTPSTSPVPSKRATSKPPTSVAPTRPASSAAEPKTSAAARTPSPAKTSSEERSAEPPLTTTVPIGVRVQGPYLDLTASGTMTGGDVYAILVETCVRSLPRMRRATCR